MSILSLFSLLGAQQAAAERLDTHLAVTAGAGSGKTRALVARYLNFVEQGAPLRSLIAITFTDKAAREMRSRIRQKIENWLVRQEAEGAGGNEPGAARDVWHTAFIELDSARIGTIHALCADLLRLYPAEAGVDPRFTVLEEGIAATLQAQAVETALAWAATDADAARLFAAFKESEIRRILGTLMAGRLDAGPALSQPDPLTRWSSALNRWLDESLDSPEWADALATLCEYASANADDTLERARRDVLAGWDELQAARTAGDWNALFSALRELRKAVSTRGQQRNWDAAALEAVRKAMRSLKEYYDDTFASLTDCRWDLDEQAAELLPALRRLFERALGDYQSLKDDRRALDFDDLEDMATRLLTETRETRITKEMDSPLSLAHAGRATGTPGGRGAGEDLRAVLVDEFQDTNERQRQIVYALTGFGEKEKKTEQAAANLFIVGDAKQSIYRFRGADVTVFRRIQADISRSGGEVIDLDLTFRAHQPLLDQVERLLTPLMGGGDDAHAKHARPYRVPFAPLTAYRRQPAEGVCGPFVEFQIGVGEDAEAGRRAAAAALAARLHELREREGFEWDCVALLFRASTAFPVYEDALEAAGIPFVTVAGKGFYDRPEIRDLLNALAAIADPADDLALAGLLRSPAFALTDADLYHLRFPNGGDTRAPLYHSLLPHSTSNTNSNSTLSLAGNTISTLHVLAGRLPVAELLKRFLDLTHYRAILKAARGTQRLSRNVDKLLADAHRSRLVSVGDFLEYVQSLRDVGAREGEAPAEVGGAVQLMTVHKAKGLEFRLVIIADAAFEHRGGSAIVRPDPELGVLLRVQTSRPGVPTDKARPFAWQLGALAAEDREDAEDLRLLYVAFTRAKEKVIVSGHIRISAARNDPGRLLLSGWLARLASVIGLDEARLPQTEGPGIEGRWPSGPSGNEMTAPLALRLSPDWAASVTATLYLPPEAPSVTELAGSSGIQPEPEAASQPGPLVTATFSPLAEKIPAGRLGEGARVWRVVSSGRDAPAWVVGQLAHQALRRWTFPDRPDFDDRLRPTALEAGLIDEAVIRAALREVRRLLKRFRAHPLFSEMNAAERFHEVPYAVGDDVGVMDLLYRAQAGWTVADFKTDELRDEAEMRAAIKQEEYEAQLRRYARAVAAHLGEQPRALLVFLNVGKAIKAVPLSLG